MSVKFDSNNRPYIELEEGHQIRCHGEVPAEFRAQRGESPEAVQEQCQKIIALCKEAGHDVSKVGHLVLTALRFHKYDAEKAAKVLILGGETARKFELNKKFDELRHVFDEGLVWYLPARDKDGSVGIVVESGKKWNPSKVSLVDLWEAARLAMQAVVNDESVQFAGIKLIIDYGGMSLTHFARYKPKSYTVMVESQKCEMVEQSMHAVNTSRLFNALYELLMPIMGKETKAKWTIHGSDWTSLHGSISPECLPPVYGGTAPDYDHRLMGELLSHLKHLFV